MRSKGITLIALIITIIILLILAGLILGNFNHKKLINSAKDVANKTQNQLDDNDKMAEDIRNSITAIEGCIITFVVGTTVFLTKKGVETIRFPSQAPVADNKVFEGWYYDAECTKEAKEGTAINQDITLYAKMVDSYTISFMANGSLFQTLTGTTVKFPNTTPTAKTLVFDGWYYDEECTKEAKAGDALTQNTTIYANMIGITNPLNGQSIDDDKTKLETVLYKYIYKGDVEAQELKGVSVYDSTKESDNSLRLQEVGGTTFWLLNDGTIKIIHYSSSSVDAVEIVWSTTVKFSVKKKDGTIVELEDSFKTSNSWWTSCLIAGTLVTLANGTKKKIEDLTYEDELLVWDFDNACMASAKPLWLQKEQKAEKYNLLKFSDGNVLKTINQHRILNIEKGKFTYPMTDETPIGTTTLNDKGEKVKLVSKEIIEEKVTYYNLITKYHMNAFTGGILTSCRFSNLYPIKDMKYVKDDRKLVGPEEYLNIPKEYYEGLRLAEQPKEVNRENDDISHAKTITEYVENLIESAK